MVAAWTQTSPDVGVGLRDVLNINSCLEISTAKGDRGATKRRKSEYNASTALD